MPNSGAKRLKPTGQVMIQPVQYSTTVRSAHTVFMFFFNLYGEKQQFVPLTP
jgi:hypothetical protein